MMVSFGFSLRQRCASKYERTLIFHILTRISDFVRILGVAWALFSTWQTLSEFIFEKAHFLGINRLLDLHRLHIAEPSPCGLNNC